MSLSVIISLIGVLFSLVAFVLSLHYSIVYNTFSKNIKAWSESIDESVNAAIYRQSLKILKDIDDRISKNEESSVSTETPNT